MRPGATVPEPLARAMMASCPPTHEIGGVFHVADGGAGPIHDVTLRGGDVCVGDDGRHTRQCTVRVPETTSAGDVPFHTHPRAHRPSSTDLKNGMRRDGASYLFTPRTTWRYGPAPGGRARWWAQGDRDRRRTVLAWRLAGALLEPRLQDPDDHAAVDLFRAAVAPHVAVDRVFTAAP